MAFSFDIFIFHKDSVLRFLNKDNVRIYQAEKFGDYALNRWIYSLLKNGERKALRLTAESFSLLV